MGSAVESTSDIVDSELAEPSKSLCRRVEDVAAPAGAFDDVLGRAAGSDDDDGGSTAATTGADGNELAADGAGAAADALANAAR